MEKVLQQIITEEINKRYVTEKAFYEGKLNITQQSWNRWKRGDRGFSDDNTLILKSLFSDYEWMLVQKIVTELDQEGHDIEKDEPGTLLYAYYLDIKKDITKKWIKNGAEIDLIAENFDDENKNELGKKVIVKLHYDLDIEQADDIITFHSKKIKGKLKDKKKKRKKWFEKNEANFY